MEEDCQPKRKDMNMREFIGEFWCYDKCNRHACSTQTLSCASVRALVRLNTVGLLKRAALERKKSNGAYHASGQRHPITRR